MHLKKIINHKSLLIITVLVSGVMYFSYDNAFFCDDFNLAIGSKTENNNGSLPSHNINKIKVTGSNWLGNPEYLEFINEMVKKLKQKHDHEIHLLNVQASFKDLRNFILERYPQDGVAIFEYIITQAFQVQSDNILALIHNLNIYDAWLSENRLSLNDMDVLERDGLLWAKRYEIFADLAHELWDKEINEQEYKQQVVQQTLQSLNDSHDIDMSERLYILQTTIEEQFSDTPQSLLINKGLLANMYFRLESVQRDLENMAPLDRQQALAKSRRQLGYTESSIADLAKQDAAKELRWKNGNQYMAQRDQLAVNFQGADLQQRLNELRTKHFSHEAATIEAEEKSGFMRYERPRVYGSN